MIGWEVETRTQPRHNIDNIATVRIPVVGQGGLWAIEHFSVLVKERHRRGCIDVGIVVDPVLPRLLLVLVLVAVLRRGRVAVAAAVLPSASRSCWRPIWPGGAAAAAGCSGR